MSNNYLFFLNVFCLILIRHRLEVLHIHQTVNGTACEKHPRIKIQNSDT